MDLHKDISFFFLSSYYPGRHGRVPTVILLFFFPLSHMPVFPLYTTSLSKQSHTFCLLRRWPMQLPTTHDRWWVDTGLFIAFLRSKGLLILLHRCWVVRLGLPMAANLKTSWQPSLSPTLLSPLLSLIHDLVLLLLCLLWATSQSRFMPN